MKKLFTRFLRATKLKVFQANANLASSLTLWQGRGAGFHFGSNWYKSGACRGFCRFFLDELVVFSAAAAVFLFLFFFLPVSLQFDWISESSRQTATRSAVSKQSQHWKVSPNLQTSVLCLVGG